MTRAFQDRAFGAATRILASSSILIVGLIFLFLIKEAVPFFDKQPWTELLGWRWVPVSFERPSFGLVPLVCGTLVVTVTAIAIALPLSLATAVYLSELASSFERETLKPFLELLASIPSVVLGFFGLVVIAPVVKAALGLDTGLTALTGGVVLAFMATPTIITVAEDAIRSVPASYREASMALGASAMQTIFHVTVPAAGPGIVAACMLGVGRVVGETMAVLMVTGNAPLVTLLPTAPVRTMTATIAAEMGEVPFGSLHYHALFCVGALLLVITFILNIVAQQVLRKAGAGR